MHNNLRDNFTPAPRNLRALLLHQRHPEALRPWRRKSCNRDGKIIKMIRTSNIPSCSCPACMQMTYHNKISSVQNSRPLRFHYPSWVIGIFTMPFMALYVFLYTWLVEFKHSNWCFCLWISKTAPGGHRALSSTAFLISCLGLSGNAIELCFTTIFFNYLGIKHSSSSSSSASSSFPAWHWIQRCKYALQHRCGPC